MRVPVTRSFELEVKATTLLDSNIHHAELYTQSQIQIILPQNYSYTKMIAATVPRGHLYWAGNSPNDRLEGGR